MKRFSLYMLIMAAAVVAACEMEPVKEMGQDPQETITPEVQTGTYIYTINASLPENELGSEFGALKSDYDADGKFSWSEGDAISVLFHNGDDNKFFTLTRVSGTGNTATFSGPITMGYTLGSSDNSNKIWALFPASDYHTYTAGGTTRPTFYIPPVNDFTAPGAHFSANLPMYDLIDSEGAFSFKYLTCGYKFTINDLDVSKVRVDIANNVSYYLSGDISMSSGPYLSFGNAGTYTSKNISYICNVTSKTAVFYVACRYAAGSFKPTITIKDADTGYTITSFAASKAPIIDNKGKIQPVSISAPGTGSPINSTLGVDWYGGSDASIVSADGDDSGVKIIKSKADDDYLYILFGVKKSLLLYREASYARSNNIQLYFNSTSPGHFCYLYRNGVAQINDASGSALTASQIVELDEDDAVFCEFKVPRTYNAAITEDGSVGVKVCVFYDFWVDSDWTEHSDWSKYKYSPEVTVTLP